MKVSSKKRAIGLIGRRFYVRTVMRIFLISALLISSHTALAMGDDLRKLHEYYLSVKGPLYDNPKLAEYVERIGQKMVAASDMPNEKFYFFVLDIPGVDAFTPGYGLIYISRGLLVQMTTEGQLAGVLAHEIGHNVANHIGEARTRNTLGSLGAVLASILAGNSDVGNAIGMRNNEKMFAMRRKNELEADELAAKYLYKANYAPDEMLSVLSLLKDQATFMDLRQNTNMATYHGLHSTHPRADKRLQEVIAKAGTLPPGEEFRGRKEFREVISGVVFGEHYTGNKGPDQERYTNKSLGITFVYPNDWSQTIKGKNIILKDAEKTVQLKVSIEKTVDKSLTSQEVLQAKYPDDLKDVVKIKPEATKDLGTHARRPQQRVGVIQVGRNTFNFQGIAKNNKLTQEQDAQMIEIIESFRRASRQDLAPDENMMVYFKRLEPGETLESLAKKVELGRYSEEYLRVMNGYYPKGEPEPGTYIKLVRREPKDKPETGDQSAKNQTASN